MIAKKIKNQDKSTGKVTRIKSLTNYVREPSLTNAHEKCTYSGARGFITDEPRSQTAEMIALSQEAVRSKDTINHYVLSWREGEQPSHDHVEEAVSVFMDELGLTDHQVIYGLHSDTDNMHLHLVINRVHQETLKMVEINKGFDIEAIHKAIARIENVQGWQREGNGRYHVLDNGELGRKDTDKPRQPDQTKRDREIRTGEKSAERIGIEEGAPIIKDAQTWEQLHRELAAAGMRYEKVGSGAVIFVGDVGVKASSADRNASLSKMQKRLGEYQPAALLVAKRKPEPIKPDVPRLPEYITGRRSHYADKTADKLAMDKRHEQERKRLADQQKAYRGDIFRGDWKGKGDLLNAMRSVIAAEQVCDTVALKEKHQLERKRHREQYRPYPDFEQWLRMQGDSALAEQWRHRASEPPPCIEGDGNDGLPRPRDIRAYKPVIRGQQVQYIRDGVPGRAAFVDKGKSIVIYDWRNEDSVLAALQLAGQKWPRGVTVTGSDDYKAMCVRLAVAHGVKVLNPELQEAISSEKTRLAGVQQAVDAEKESQRIQKEEIHRAKEIDKERERRIQVVSDVDLKSHYTGPWGAAYLVDKYMRMAKEYAMQEPPPDWAEIDRLIGASFILSVGADVVEDVRDIILSHSPNACDTDTAADYVHRTVEAICSDEDVAAILRKAEADKVR